MGFASYLAFEVSFWSALAYAGIFLVAVWLATAITSATRLNINLMIAGSTVALIVINAGLIWWFVGYASTPLSDAPATIPAQQPPPSGVDRLPDHNKTVIECAVQNILESKRRDCVTPSGSM
jgi:hypothetical protein